MTGYDLIEELLRLPADALNQPVVIITERRECDNAFNEMMDIKDSVITTSVIINSATAFSSAPDADGNFIRLQ